MWHFTRQDPSAQDFPNFRLFDKHGWCGHGECLAFECVLILFADPVLGQELLRNLFVEEMVSIMHCLVVLLTLSVSGC